MPISAPRCDSVSKHPTQLAHEPSGIDLRFEEKHTFSQGRVGGTRCN